MRVMTDEKVEQIIKDDLASAKMEELLKPHDWEWTESTVFGVVVKRGYKCPDCGCVCMEMECGCGHG